jgi:hypothetical protein
MHGRAIGSRVETALGSVAPLWSSEIKGMTGKREEVHHVPTVQAELSAQIERGWFIQFDLHLVPNYSCYREG